MNAIYCFLRSAYVLLSLISDNLLLLDWWIITPPGSLSKPDQPSKDAWAKRWLATLRTACTYGILEPLWFRLMENAAPIWTMWYFSFSAFVHAQAGGLASTVMAEALIKEVRKHQKYCRPGGGEGLVNSESAEDETTDTSHLLEMESHLPSRDASAQSEARSGDSCGKHDLPLSVKLVLLVPATSAAAANTGLWLYAAYLHSDHSKAFFERSAFGWTVLALFGIAVLVISKLPIRILCKLCNRHVWVLDRRWKVDMGLRVLSFATMFVLRSLLRLLLNQPIITAPTFDQDGLAFSAASLAFLELPKNSTEENQRQEALLQSSFARWCSYLTPVFLVIQFGCIWYQRRRPSNAPQSG